MELIHTNRLHVNIQTNFKGACQKFKQHAQNGQKFLAQGNTLGGIVINK